MMFIPLAEDLPVECLASGFENTTNSYKFYWFLSILEHIRENQTRIINISDLITRMVTEVWYPASYFRLSFGKQDRLGQVTLQVGMEANLLPDAGRQDLINAVESCMANHSSLSKSLNSFGQYVPYRFLRPFFADQLRGVDDWKINTIIEKMAAQTFSNGQKPCLYRFMPHSDNAIEVHPLWFKYLNRHLTILMGFCLWHLLTYIQKNNPNVPNISNKLFEPKTRDLKAAKLFWNLVMENPVTLKCIYSGQEIHKGSYSLDHFLPWRFVGHDLLWNIIPTPKQVNSSKSDNLPDIEKYFDIFADSQYKAIQTVACTSKTFLLEDHLILFGMSSINDLRIMSYQYFRDKLYDTMAPQFQIAINMGFSWNWKYA